MAETTFKSIKLPNMTDPARVPETAAEFSTSTNYNLRDYCTYQGKLYRCIVAHAAGAWNSADFQETNIGSELDSKLGIPVESNTAPTDPVMGDLWIDTSAESSIYMVDPYPVEGSHNPVESNGMASALKTKANKINLAGDFSTSATYLVGDYTLYEGQFYKCIEQHSQSAWNPAHFKATSIGTEINSREDIISKGVSDWLDEHPESIVGVTEGSITAPLLATNSVTSEKIRNGEVTNPKLAPGAVGTENLKSDLIVPIGKGGTNSTTAAGALVNLGAQKVIQKASGTLLSTGWSSNKTQNLSITGLISESEFIASPNDATSWAAAADATLYPPTAANGALIFSCEDIPSTNINITVYWW